MALEVTVRTITHRWTGATLWQGKATSVRHAVEQAVSRGANLGGADLGGANLRGADLRGANLRGADLGCANLGCANLGGADLRGAHLRGADLGGADLGGADLGCANLRGADLGGADLRGADLRSIRDDLWAVLSAAPHEVVGLLAAIRDGRIDGSTYSGDCACLIGTIANVRHCHYDALPVLKPDSRRPAEVWFLQIHRGDTPATNPFAKLAEEWTVDWLDRMHAAFGAAPVGAQS